MNRLIEGQRPKAPEILRTFLDLHTDQATVRGFHETAEYAREQVKPVLRALAQPEVYSSSSTYIDGVQQEDLWRRIMPDVQFDLDGQEATVGVVGIFQADGHLRDVVFNTVYDMDRRTIAAAGPHRERGNKDVVWSPRGIAWTGDELKQLRGLTDLVVSEAPKQALAEGMISPSWMQRWEMRHPDEAGFPYAEGFPAFTVLGGKPVLYEVVSWNGMPSVCSVVDGDSGKGWKEDVHGEVVLPQERVAAWKRVGLIQPEYYVREKYPLRSERPLTPAHI